jgi:hypothetical protein
MIATSSPEFERLKESANRKNHQEKRKRSKTGAGAGPSAGEYMKNPKNSIIVHEDSESDIEEEPYPLMLDTVNDLSVDDFVLCEFSSQANRAIYYVGQVKNVSQNQVKVEFFRKNPKVDNWFVRPDVDDIQEIPFTMVRSRLNRKVESANTTSRTKNVFSFYQRLNDLNIN